MKKYFLFLHVLCMTTCMQGGVFKFVDYKVKDSLGKNFIKNMVETFKPDIFFETGTWNGGTTLNAVPYFKSVYTVELHEKIFNSKKKKFSQFKNIYAYNGKSANTIKRVAPTINGRILFWLDAHFSGEGTALTFNDPSAAKAITPIREELAAIQEANIQDCIILIDDIRGFGTKIKNQEYIGCWAYPTLQEVKELLLKINDDFECVLLGDMLLAYDKNKYQPNFTQTVQACTKTRLYDGYNLSDEQLLQLEEKIMHASTEEKEFIKQLYNKMTDYKDPMLWHDMWFALIELGSGNYRSARKAFSKVKVRKQLFNKNRKKVSKTIRYDHWRIDTYLNACG